MWLRFPFLDIGVYSLDEALRLEFLAFLGQDPICSPKWRVTEQFRQVVEKGSYSNSPNLIQIVIFPCSCGSSSIRSLWILFVEDIWVYLEAIVKGLQLDHHFHHPSKAGWLHIMVDTSTLLLYFLHTKLKNLTGMCVLKSVKTKVNTNKQTSNLFRAIRFKPLSPVIDWQMSGMLQFYFGCLVTFVQEVLQCLWS